MNYKEYCKREVSVEVKYLETSNYYRIRSLHDLYELHTKYLPLFKVGTSDRIVIGKLL